MNELIASKKASVFDINNVNVGEARVKNVFFDKYTEGHITSENLNDDNIVLDNKILDFDEDVLDKLGTEGYVTFYHPVKGLITYACEFSVCDRVFLQFGQFHYPVFCTLKEEISVIQRREDIKIDTNIKIKIQWTDADKHIQHSDAIIKDLSAGGLFLITTHRFYAGDIYTFYLPGTPTVPSYSAAVLRVQDPKNPPPDGNTYIGYGCRFLQMSRYGESTLRQYIYREDLHIRARA